SIDCWRIRPTTRVTPSSGRRGGFTRALVLCVRLHATGQISPTGTSFGWRRGPQSSGLRCPVPERGDVGCCIPLPGTRPRSSATDPGRPAQAWLGRHYAGLTAWLNDAIARGSEEGTMQEGMPVEHVVATSIAVLDGLQQQWARDAGTVSMVGSVRNHVRGPKTLWGVGTAAL